MYEDVTPERVRTRILGRLKTDLQTREGSFTNDVIAAASVEISELYHSLDALLPSFYVDETSGQFIDRQAGIGPPASSPSRGAAAPPFPPEPSITRPPDWRSPWRRPSPSRTGPGRER